MLVPNRFKVPDDDVAWPEKTWNMTLGSVVNDIRSGHSYVDKREDLLSIGFDYSSQAGDFLSEIKCREIFQEIFFPSLFDKAYPSWLKSPFTNSSLQLNGRIKDCF
jgi:hypothetical protein